MAKTKLIDYFKGTQDFEYLFEYQQNTYAFGSITKEMIPTLEKGFKNLSPESIQQRYFAAKSQLDQKDMDQLTHPTATRMAFGIKQNTSPYLGVGVIRLFLDLAQSEGELSLTIVDKFQKKGFGSLLFHLGLSFLLVRNIKKLNLTYLASNNGIQKIINLYLPYLETTKSDSLTLKSTLKLSENNLYELNQTYLKAFGFEV